MAGKEGCCSWIGARHQWQSLFHGFRASQVLWSKPSVKMKSSALVTVTSVLLKRWSGIVVPGLETDIKILMQSCLSWCFFSFMIWVWVRIWWWEMGFRFLSPWRVMQNRLQQQASATLTGTINHQFSLPITANSEYKMKLKHWKTRWRMESLCYCIMRCI